MRKGHSRQRGGERKGPEAGEDKATMAKLQWKQKGNAGGRVKARERQEPYKRILAFERQSLTSF